ncbi:molybdopterin molybdotransferase MoeA [Mucilaginibacter arboris]|uniref:Molybdopterin molybdenumtransferase n=1 Tax=Mucilaginibacter arboris TaxID=2682090 RepID=A0A7K1SWW1_9SPHI|nr:molybdopterin molybdotransferase MoeA [Mucilaginibacter arboris]MVN21806.1 molybdopterin molybdenumtransferase MoeA [Mucilaginibacter arboris]
MLNYKEAQQIITSLAKSFGQETLSLDEAYGRVLAEQVFADRDYPPFNRATMDGYAINFKDWGQRINNYAVKEVVFAGQRYGQEVLAGECYKIMTGAAVPPNVNLVIRWEDATETNGHVSFNVETVKPFQNIAKKGEDIQANTCIIDQNIICPPSVIALLATVGKATVQVEKLPNVALFTTGDEVVEPGQPVSDIQIRNSNQFLLKSLLKQWQIKPAICKHILDDKEQLKQAISAALNSDMIILCGGVSAGDADYVPEILENLGVKKLFHQVKIKPGKPIWCGQLPSGGLVFALPGNPFSCHVTFKLFIEHHLRYCFGLSEKELAMLPLSTQKLKKTTFDEFFPAIVNQEVTPILFNSSGDVKAALTANAIAVHPAETSDLQAGSLVAFHHI